MANRIDFWELSEAERACLSEDQVRACEAYELMRAGVVRAQPPETLKEREPVELAAFYTVSHAGGRYGRDTLTVAFGTPEEARAFIDSDPLVTTSHYMEGVTITSVDRLSRHEPKIDMLEAAARELVDTHRAELEKYCAAKKKHDAERSEFEKNATAERRAIEGLWADWYRCRERASALGRVVSTHAEYQKLAGSDELAGKFLLKAFKRHEIEAACEWFNVTIPLPAEDPAVEPAPVEDAAAAF